MKNGIQIIKVLGKYTSQVRKTPNIERQKRNSLKRNTKKYKYNEALKETDDNKKPTKRLKDIKLVSLSPVGLFKK